LILQTFARGGVLSSTPWQVCAGAAQANQIFISFLRGSTSNDLRWFVKIISDHSLKSSQIIFKII